MITAMTDSMEMTFDDESLRNAGTLLLLLLLLLPLMLFLLLLLLLLSVPVPSGGNKNGDTEMI